MQNVERLIDQYGNSVYSFCRKLTNNKHDADDLYQQTFLKTIEIKNKIDYKKNVKNLLITIAISIWKNSIRKKARHNKIAPVYDYQDINTFEIIDVNTNIEVQVIRNETKNQVNLVVGGLKEKYRLPIILYYNMQLSIGEIATILKVPKGTVKSRLFKARDIIKTGLEVGGYEDCGSGKSGEFA